MNMNQRSKAGSIEVHIKWPKSKPVKIHCTIITSAKWGDAMCYVHTTFYLQTNENIFYQQLMLEGSTITR